MCWGKRGLSFPALLVVDMRSSISQGWVVVVSSIGFFIFEKRFVGLLVVVLFRRTELDGCFLLSVGRLSRFIFLWASFLSCTSIVVRNDF